MRSKSQLARSSALRISRSEWPRLRPVHHDERVPFRMDRWAFRYPEKGWPIFISHAEQHRAKKRAFLPQRRSSRLSTPAPVPITASAVGAQKANQRNGECEMWNAELQCGGRTGHAADRANPGRSIPHSAFRTPHSWLLLAERYHWAAERIIARRHAGALTSPRVM